MPEAARLGDQIGHSPMMSGLLTGLLVGAAVGLAAVAVVGTGGLAGAAIVAGLAAGGGGIGQVISTMSFVPKTPSGVIATGSPDVFINGRPAARAHDDVTACAKHSRVPPPIASGSSNVFINGMPAARIDDQISCGAVIIDGSSDVLIGVGTVQTDVVAPEHGLVPDWVNNALLAVGLGSALVLGGPIVAGAAFLGGAAGGFAGSWAGGELFGQGSDGQKWMMLGGAILGGGLGAKGGTWFNSRYTVTTQGLGANGGNIKITRRPQAQTYIGRLRGEEVHLRGVKTETISYTKRSRAEYKELRRAFESKERGDFLRDLGNDPAKVAQLRKAGLNDAQIAKVADGKVPEGWEVHHKLPLDDGGTNAAENLVLIKKDPHHYTISNAQRAATKGMQEGDTRTIEWPIPQGSIYPS